MSQDQTPDDFDWVVAQSKCSAASMFARLQAGVKEDVRRRNGLGRSGRDDGWTFEFHIDGEEFEVSRVEASGVAESIDSTLALVRFERAGRRIHVHGDGVDVEFTAVVSLDVAGVCRLVVGEAMYSEWEIRRMALEQLFFEEEEEVSD
jgi:hypothetical protein